MGAVSDSAQHPARNAQNKQNENGYNYQYSVHDNLLFYVAKFIFEQLNYTMKTAIFQQINIKSSVRDSPCKEILMLRTLLEDIYGICRIHMLEFGSFFIFVLVRFVYKFYKGGNNKWLLIMIRLLII